MAKRQPKLTNDIIRAAINRAMDGKGRQLAQIIKGCSLDDLTRGLERAGEYHKEVQGRGLFLHGLTTVLAVVDGRREGRAEFSQWKKEARVKRKPTEADTHHG